MAEAAAEVHSEAFPFLLAWMFESNVTTDRSHGGVNRRVLVGLRVADCAKGAHLGAVVFSCYQHLLGKERRDDLGAVLRDDKFLLDARGSGVRPSVHLQLTGVR